MTKQYHFSADGSDVDVYVRAMDPTTGDHIDPDGWLANPNSADVTLTEYPSAVHAGTRLSQGEYRFTFSGLSPAVSASATVHAVIDGAIASVAWTTLIIPIVVSRPWLITLGTNAPSNWINAAAIAAGALNDKGNWSKAGDAMALTSGERSTLATAVEAALLNEGDGQQLLAAISAQVQALFDSGADIPVSTLVTLIRDGILNRVLSGNHETAGTVGKVLQDTVADTAELQTDWANGGRLDLLVDQAIAEAQLARRVLANKHVVVESPPGTFTISVRNDDDTATVRTIVYIPATGARTVS
ncbi:MAG: hypothetical protein JNL58_04505 [Planctomyces sp.]|nr:hypothetical protein [Planctomyces sp.]